MLVNNPLRREEYWPRRWSLLAAILVAGVALQAVAASGPEKKQDKKEEKKDADKKEAQPLPGFPNVEDLFQQLPPGLDEAQRKLMEDHLKRVRQMMQQMQQQFPGGNLPPLPGFPGGIDGGLPQLPPLQLPRLRARFGGMGGFNPLGQQQHQPRLGARVEKPSAALVDQLDLPRGQGLVLDEVLNDSAAAKAGLKANDILLELNGKPVPSDPAEFTRLLQDVKPDTKVDAVVMRKTRKETIKGLSLPKVPEVQQQPGFNFQFPNVPFGNGRRNGRGNFGGGGGSTSIHRSNDAFTARNQQGEVAVTITGKMTDGKAEVSEIQVQDGGKTIAYKSVDKLPEQYRDTAQKLLNAVQGRRVRLRIN